MMLRLLLPVMVVALALFTAACGGDDGGGTVEPAGTPTAAGEEPASTSTAPGESPAATEPSEATPSPTLTEDGDVIVECGDPLVPVNKVNRLPEDCAPNDLVTLPDSVSYGSQQEMTSESADALLEMLSAASNEGYEILARSTYRSYQTQVATYQWHVDNLGREEADRVSARPGHSEHQLGTTADLTTAEVGFELLESLGDTAAGVWLADNASNYGFVMSYPEGTEHITGYSYEPWHFRYVGTDVAQDVRATGLTLHEYLLQR